MESCLREIKPVIKLNLIRKRLEFLFCSFKLACSNSLLEPIDFLTWCNALTQDLLPAACSVYTNISMIYIVFAPIDSLFYTLYIVAWPGFFFFFFCGENRHALCWQVSYQYIKGDLTRSMVLPNFLELRATNPGNVRVTTFHNPILFYITPRNNIEASTKWRYVL